MQRLEWKDIRFDVGIIEIHAGKAKTARLRTFPILDNLRQWFLPHRPGRSGAGQGWKNRSTRAVGGMKEEYNGGARIGFAKRGGHA
ncbi:MAG: hypothetical protein FJ404_15060 [Verrucomicrobia bacterium]|nr:hypothetical protein [Verrucomicrobiota bacterium]